jgi:hypothetical protein
MTLHFKFWVVPQKLGSWNGLFFSVLGALDAYHCLFVGMSTHSIRVGLFLLCDRYELHFVAI